MKVSAFPEKSKIDFGSHATFPMPNLDPDYSSLRNSPYSLTFYFSQIGKKIDPKSLSHDERGILDEGCNGEKTC